LVAVFWADVDITGEGGGEVWYRTVTQHQDRVLLQRISTFARSYHQGIPVEQEFPVDLSFTWALIVTWDHVGYNNKHTNKVYAVGIHAQHIYMYLQCYTQKAVRVEATVNFLSSFHTAQHIPACSGNRWSAFSGTLELCREWSELGGGGP